MSDFADALAAYVRHLEARHYSPRTIASKAWCLERFLSFLDQIGVPDLGSVSFAVLERFREERATYRNRYGRSDSVKTQSHYIEAVRGFFGWLHASGRILVNPALDFSYPRMPKRLPLDTLEHDEMRLLLEQPDLGTVLGFRDRTLMEFLYSTGVRLSEMRAVAVEDLDLERGTVVVREGKGGKDRVVPVGRLACLFLENYVAGIRPLLVAPTSSAASAASGAERGAGRGAGRVVFLSRRGNAISRNALHSMLKRYTAAAGIEKPVSTHTFRRSFATELFRGGAKAAHVKDMLGHDDFASLSVYLKLTIRDLKQAHQRFHPRERSELGDREDLEDLEDGQGGESSESAD